MRWDLDVLYRAFLHPTNWAAIVAQVSDAAQTPDAKEMAASLLRAPPQYDIMNKVVGEAIYRYTRDPAYHAQMPLTERGWLDFLIAETAMRVVAQLSHRTTISRHRSAAIVSRTGGGYDSRPKVQFSRKYVALASTEGRLRGKPLIPPQFRHLERP